MFWARYLAVLFIFLLASRSAGWDSSIEKTGEVDVRGKVARPGVVEISNGTLLGEVLRQAGGVTATASGIEVHRPVAGVSVALRFNLAEDPANAAPARIAEFKVYAGDRVLVGDLIVPADVTKSDLWTDSSTANVRIIGHVWQPGHYRLAPGTTLRTAVAIAGGGMKPRSTLHKVLVKRPEGVSHRHLYVDLRTPEGDEMLIQPNDVILIGETLF